MAHRPAGDAARSPSASRWTVNKLLRCVVLAAAVMVAAPVLAQSGFAGAVAAGDGEVFIGESRNVISPGYVYVYRSSEDGWREVARLSADDAADRDGFGASLFVDGDVLLVGGSGAGAGMVYVFEHSADTWRQVATVSSGDGIEGDDFGGALALQDDRMVVGAPGHGERQGAAYVFERGASGWTQVAKLVATNPTPEEQEAAGRGGRGQRGGQAAGGQGGGQAAGGQGGGQAAGGQGGGGGGGGRGGRDVPPMFGATVALNGDWAAVGAPNYSSRAGSVYVFRRGGDGWQQVAQFPGNDAQEGAAFGSAIVLGDDEMFIGASGAHGGIGGVSITGWRTMRPAAPGSRPASWRRSTARVAAASAALW
jgi:hypothetical protein